MVSEVKSKNKQAERKKYSILRGSSACCNITHIKEDNSTGSFNLCHLSCVFGVIIKSGTMCTSVHLCALLCMDGTVVYMCPCILLVTVCILCYWIYVN